MRVRNQHQIHIVVLLVLLGLVTTLTACGPNISFGGVTFGHQRTPQPIITVANQEPVQRARSSENWGGYAVTTTNVTGVSASWQVPQVTNPSTSDSSTWVGIGGMFSSSLIQAGTDQQIQHGHPFYYAWIELLPAAPQPLTGIDILPGDTVSVTITNLQSDQWQIVFQNIDSKQSSTKTVTYNSCRCSAEWIEEVPSVKGQQTLLADFTSITFKNATATINSLSGQINTLKPRAIRMIDATGQVVLQPQVIHGDSFSVVDLGGGGSLGK